MSYNKMLLRRIYLTIFLGLFPLNIFAQNFNELFEQGIEAYSNEDYTVAVESWEQILNTGYYSSELYYNLGNANFKLGSIPGAILYYEKALLLKPFKEDYRYNLEIAKTFTSDRFETVPEIFFIKWYKMVSLTANSNQWALISLISFIVALIVILAFLLTPRLRMKKITLALGAIVFMVSIVSISLSYMNNMITQKKAYVIIFSSVVTGKSSPGLNGKELFVIHEGTKVRIEDQVGEWIEVRLSDGNIGWILLSDAKKV